MPSPILKPLILITHGSGEPPRVEAMGMQGPTCATKVREVTQALGSEIVHSEHKPEFHARIIPTTRHTHTQTQTT